MEQPLIGVHLEHQVQVHLVTLEQAEAELATQVAERQMAEQVALAYSQQAEVLERLAELLVLEETLLALDSQAVQGSEAEPGTQAEVLDF